MPADQPIISRKTALHFNAAEWRDADGKAQPLAFSFHSILRSLLPDVAVHPNFPHVKPEYKNDDARPGIARIEHKVAQLDGALRSVKMPGNEMTITVADAKDALGRMKALFDPEDEFGQYARQTVDQVSQTLGLDRVQENTRPLAP